MKAQAATSYTGEQLWGGMDLQNITPTVGMYETTAFSHKNLEYNFKNSKIIELPNSTNSVDLLIKRLYEDGYIATDTCNYDFRDKIKVIHICSYEYRSYRYKTSRRKYP